MNYPVEHQTNQAARQELKHEAIEFVKMIVWFLILFGILKTFVIEGYEVQGDSMMPTLVDRERILVFKLPHNLSKIGFLSGIEALHGGDVIVFDSTTGPDKRYVQRVIACGIRERRGNTVEAKDDKGRGCGIEVEFEEGRVFVEGHHIKEPYLSSDAAFLRNEIDARIVHPNQYYVLGDNRPVSRDSRSFGPIDNNAVIGKAIFRFWPPSRFGPL